jgi:hypothetical protein
MSPDYHNKGQEDRAKGDYSPPHGLMDGLIDFISSSDAEWSEHIRENEAYDAGWSNTNEQLK